MKARFATIIPLVALSVILILWPAPASAQLTALRFNVPFAFVAGGHVLAPGQYALQFHTGEMRIAINDTASTASSMVPLVPGGSTRPAAQADSAMLRFEKVGGRYFLTGVWRRGAVNGDSIMPSRRMLESAKAGAPGAVAAYVDVR